MADVNVYIRQSKDNTTSVGATKLRRKRGGVELLNTRNQPVWFVPDDNVSYIEYAKNRRV